MMMSAVSGGRPRRLVISDIILGLFIYLFFRLTSITIYNSVQSVQYVRSRDTRRCAYSVPSPIKPIKECFKYHKRCTSNQCINHCHCPQAYGRSQVHYSSIYDLSHRPHVNERSPAHNNEIQIVIVHSGQCNKNHIAIKTQYSSTR